MRICAPRNKNVKPRFLCHRKIVKPSPHIIGHILRLIWPTVDWVASAATKSEGMTEKTGLFRATLFDASLFRSTLEAISELISEGVFHATSDGISFLATDPTMVTLVNMKYAAKAFDEYKTEGKADIAVNLENLLSVLRRARAGDKVTLGLEKGANRMQIVIRGESTRRFTIPILDIEESKPPEMKLDFPATIEVKTGILADGIEDASIVTDTVIFAAKPEAFQMIAEGDLSKVELDLEKGASESLVKITTKGATRSKFSLDYLKKIIKAAKITDVVKIELGNDYPIRLTFSAPNKCTMSYVLAPRVED